MRKFAMAGCGAAVLLGGGVAGVPAAAADGATTAYTDNGGHAVFYEGGGVTNNITIEQSPDGTQFVLDDQVPIAVGDGCFHPDSADATYVICTLTEFGDFWTHVEVDLGEGHDALLLRAGDENFASGGPGSDRLDVVPVTVSHGDGGDDWLVGGWLQRGGAGDDSMQRLSQDGQAYGDDGDDYFWGNSSRSSLFGGRGDDVFEARGRNDTVYGNSGEDEIHGGTGHDALFGGPEDDVIYGNSGNDELHGGPGGDRLSGGPGSDTVRQD